MESSKRYGCYNRSEFKKYLLVQDGWIDEVKRCMKSIPFTMSQKCEYDLNTTDKRCKDCGHSGTSKEG